MLNRGPRYQADRQLLRDRINLDHARLESEFAVCTRRQVGAVIRAGVAPYFILGTGYNGTGSGKPHCSFEEKGCERGLRSKEDVPPGSDYNAPGWRCAAIHAEHNAILQAIEAGGREALRGATIYVTDDPCAQCSALITAMGITRVVTPNRLKKETEEIRDPEFVEFNRRGEFGIVPVCERIGCGHTIGDHWDPKAHEYAGCRFTGCVCPGQL